MTQVRFHRLADKELREVSAWYRKHDAHVASRFKEAVEASIERIQQDPESHPVELKQFRWVKIRRFPYKLVFQRADPDEIMIVAVAHTSRRPRYWRRRK
jgi:plasmid stabilization system protein ParE